MASQLALAASSMTCQNGHPNPFSNTMRPLPANMLPLPAGMTLLGYGDTFQRYPDGQNFAGAMLHDTEWNESSFSGDSSSRLYAALIGEPILGIPENRAQIEHYENLLAGRITTPMPEAAFRAPPVLIDQLHEDYVIVGWGGDFAASDHDEIGFRSSINGRWTLENLSDVYSNSFYAFHRYSRTVANEANAAAIAFYRGHQLEESLTATPIPTSIPSPIPSNPRIPVPPDFHYLGYGGSFQLPTTQIFNGISLETGRSEWSRGRLLIGNSTQIEYAAAIGSAIHLLNTHMDSPTEHVSLPAPLEVPVEAIESLARTMVPIGCGRDISPHTARPVMASYYEMVGGWTARRMSRLSRQHDLYAVDANSPALEPNRNQALALLSRRLRSIHDIQDEDTYKFVQARTRLPEDYVVIGWASDIAITNLERFDWTATWGTCDVWVDQHEADGVTEKLIAAHRDGSLAAAYAANVWYYNQPESRGEVYAPAAFRTLPPEMPPVPDGYVCIGYGNRENVFSPSYNGIIIGMWFDPGSQSWWGPGELSWGDEARDQVFAVVSDGACAHLLHAQVQFYRSPEALPLGALPAEPPASLGPALFRLSFNGSPVASAEEFSETIAPLVANPSELATTIWRALYNADPESCVAPWIDREPVVLSGIDFHPVEPSGALTLVEPAGPERPISEIIIRATAGALLRGGLSNHFNYLESGELVANPENPPSIEQGYEVIRRTLEIRETGQKLENYSSWTLGMLGNQMELLFGDAFDSSMVLAATSKAYNTYITALGVFRSCWSTRRLGLSFTHHKEAHYAKIEPEQKDVLLDLCVEHRLSVSEQRKVTSYIRNYGTEELLANPPSDTVELMERIEVRSVNKNYLFYLPSRSQWYEYRGPYEFIPNGATPVFNADTRARIDTGGTASKLETWSPVGMEMPYLRGHAAVLEVHRAEAAATDSPVERSRGGNAGPRHENAALDNEPAPLGETDILAHEIGIFGVSATTL